MAEHRTHVSKQLVLLFPNLFYIPAHNMYQGLVKIMWKTLPVDNLKEDVLNMKTLHQHGLGHDKSAFGHVSSITVYYSLSHKGSQH